MPQFLFDPGRTPEGRFELTGAEAFHAVKVLRYAKGQALSLFDGRGGRYEGVLEDIRPDGTAAGRIVRAEAAAPAAKVHLLLGLLKAAHFDDALDKAVQLGADSVTPLLTPRTVVLLHEVERAKTKRQRWERLAASAAKQCGRADLPPIREPEQFRDAVRSRAGKGLLLMAWEGLRGAPARPALREALAAAPGREIFVFVGPEGGFTEEEVELAQTEGAALLGLGPRVLRAETAAAAALALVRYELEAA